MPDDRLEAWLALNAQLAALDAAGTPLALGVRGAELRRRLGVLNERVPLRVGAGAALGEAVSSSADVATPEYARLVEEWLAGAELAELLAARHQTATQRDSQSRRLGWRLAYPFLVAVLACVGMAVMLRTVTPIIEETLADARLAEGWGVATARALRETTPVWLIGAPLLLAAAYWWVRRARPLRLTRGSRALGSVVRRSWAQRCDEAAALLDAGSEPAAAMRLVSGSPDGGAPQSTGPPPPLLRWAHDAAAQRDQPGVDASDLRAIGDAYDGFARQGGERYTALAPLVACVVIGGGATLLYALTLFVPTIELLWGLAS